MREAEVTAKIRERMPFLFDQYGYHIIACALFANLGNWIVVLESPRAGRLLVMQDNQEIIVAIGPHGPDSSATAVPWFDIAVVLEYLSRGKLMLEDIPGNPDQQLTWLAMELRPYMERVCDLFGVPDEFAQARPELDRIGGRREADL